VLGLLVSHGSPTILIEDLPWKKELRELGEKIRREYEPDLVVVLSPHFMNWGEDNLIEAGEKLKCIQDYYGFPEELYRYCYEMPNDVEVVEKLSTFLRKDYQWGLDHGGWIPLYYMFPEGGIKGVTISISNRSPEEHYRLGVKIGEVLRETGRKPLVIATSSPTHRLDLYSLKVGRDTFFLFDHILQDLIEEGRFEEIVKIQQLFPKEFKNSSPEGDLKPLYVMLGIVRPTLGKVIYYDVPWSGVSMMLASFQ